MHVGQIIVVWSFVGDMADWPLTLHSAEKKFKHSRFNGYFCFGLLASQLY
jgi:hypothetical protein